MGKKKVIIIGAGFGGLSAAAYLAKSGFDVTILEKNSWVGGRAQVWKNKGYTFDLGPTWYWMPEVFENFFQDFGYKSSQFYELSRLDPSYRIYFEDDIIDLPADPKKMHQLFEEYEDGAGKKLVKLLAQTEKVYAAAMKHFIPKTFNSYKSLLDNDYLIGGIKVLAQYNGFRSVDKFLRQYFKNEKLIKILHFPIFFLGGSSKQIPSVYSIMNHVDINLGTWWPQGGFGELAKAYETVAKNQGVKILRNHEVKSVAVDKSFATQVTTTNGEIFSADIVVANSDYRHTEDALLSTKHQSYSAKYWENRKLAPSALTVYLGLNKKVKRLLHHTLLFNQNWDTHNKALFDHPSWPDNPLLYIACPTKTDPTLAPKGCDALTILIPIASGLKDTDEIRSKYFNIVLDNLENTLSEDIRNSIVVKKIYSSSNFIMDYNAFKGNAYGLSQTANQTAIFRPRNKSKKLNNLYYVGQFTVPGIGLPMVTISGQITAQDIIKKYGK